MLCSFGLAALRRAARSSRGELPLSFLSASRYAATIWKDAADVDADPNDLETQTLSLTPADSLKLRLGLDGGFVARVVPVEGH